MIIIRIFLLIFFIGFAYCDSNYEIASFTFVEGECLLKNDRVFNQFQKILPGRNIYSGDIIKTKDDSFCTIQFNDKKTSITLDQNSSVHILDNVLSREIKLHNGSIYVKNLHDEFKKCYVFTSSNQVFVDNNSTWIKTSYTNGDYFFSVSGKVDIFNYNNNLKKNITPGMLSHIDYSGKYFESSNYSVIPDYVINEISNKKNKKNILSLKKDDLIPIYGQRVYNTKINDLYNLSFGLGPSVISDTTYLKFSINPKYKKDNFYIGFDLDTYIGSEGNFISKDWDDFFDILDKTSGYYSYINDVNEMSIWFGNDINNVSFGQGYLLDDLSTNIDVSKNRNSGIYLKYKFDNDFMDLDVLLPNIRDFSNSGGVVALRTSLYISHKFPLTLGLGFVADFDQFSAISNQINKKVSKKRNVIGVELDFNYEILSNINKEIHLFSEFVGIWYPEYNYYTFFDNDNVSNDLRWRKGTWGIKGPGISIKMKNRYEVKLSLNINSATFIPNYFNSTYLYNRARHYTDDDLSYPLVQKQIDFIENNFLITGTDDEYLIPKDVYPILFTNTGHSPYPVSGFTTEYSYKIFNYLSTSSKLSVFFENSNLNNQYYTLESSLNINDQYIRGLNYMNIYFSNTFFSKVSDKERMIFGFESSVKLPFRLALIINLAQVYYDSNLANNSIDAMMDFGLNLNYNF